MEPAPRSRRGEDRDVIARIAPAAHGQASPPQDGPPAGPAPSVSIDQAVDAWVRHMELSELSRAQIKNSRNLVRKAARDGGWTALEHMTPEAVLARLAAMKEAGLSPKTRNEVRSAVSRFGEFAKSKGWIAANPADGSPRAKLRKHRARVVPCVDDVRRLIEAVRGDWRKRDRWVVYLTAASTGLRWRTLKLLERDAAVLDDELPPRIEIPPDLWKNGEPHLVWLTAELAAVLREHLRTEYTFRPRFPVPESRLFKSVPKPTSFDRDLRKAGLEKAGPAGRTLSFHSLRHFSSNRMDWVGFSVRDRQRQNGHKTEAMTKKIYTDPESVELGRKVLAMPGLLEPPRGNPTHSSGVADGQTANGALTNPEGGLHHAPVTMLSNPTHLDPQTSADAAMGIVTDFRVGAAELSGPRHRAEGTSRKSGRLDSNHSLPGSGVVPDRVANGPAHERETPHDQVTLAVEIAEAMSEATSAQLRVLRLLRLAEGAHRGNQESGRGGGQP